MSQINNTPKEWTAKRLGNICNIIMGQSPPSSTYNSRNIGLPFFQGKAEFTELHPIVEKWCSEPNKIAEPNDILLSVRAPVGTTNIASQRCCIGRGLAAIRYPCHLFLFYYLRHIKNELEKQGTGTTFKAISGEILKNTNLILPPLHEQQKIVEAIEELFSELDKGVESLKKAKEQLKVYRQSVLKNAFEGKLTEKWRERNKEKLEPPELLLEKIRKEREETARKQGKKLKPVKSITEQELSTLPKLPKEWLWVKIGNIFDVFIGATPSRKIAEYWNGKINWVSSGEVNFKNIYSTKEKITDLGLKNSSTLLHPIDTVMLAMIGEGKTRGQVSILKAEAAHNQNTAALEVNPKYFLSNLLYYYFIFVYEKTRNIGSGNNQKALNKERIQNIHYLLFSKLEQLQIVQEIETRLSVCDEMEKTVEESLKKAEKLRQSMLKKAFEGKLTEKWRQENPELISGENSAEALLSKIKKN
ncbi:MAG TPA: hypothetical protein DD381_06505 [Lentisphaeria bacterium]|nr:MAG: hypothetical protein A2X47_13275 [Lentisphaerae bacterium GWF2_38_69]HBM15976.1 hypothetical protein [Lentisphaeria bacterium]